jgi:hypothetical protein
MIDRDVSSAIFITMASLYLILGVTHPLVNLRIQKPVNKSAVRRIIF